MSSSSAWCGGRDLLLKLLVSYPARGRTEDVVTARVKLAQIASRSPTTQLRMSSPPVTPCGTRHERTVAPSSSNPIAAAAFLAGAISAAKLRNAFDVGCHAGPCRKERRP